MQWFEMQSGTSRTCSFTRIPSMSTVFNLNWIPVKKSTFTIHDHATRRQPAHSRFTYGGAYRTSRENIMRESMQQRWLCADTWNTGVWWMKIAHMDDFVHCWPRRDEKKAPRLHPYPSRLWAKSWRENHSPCRTKMNLIINICAAAIGKYCSVCLELWLQLTFFSLLTWFLREATLLFAMCECVPFWKKLAVLLHFVSVWQQET